MYLSVPKVLLRPSRISFVFHVIRFLRAPVSNARPVISGDSASVGSFLSLAGFLVAVDGLGGNMGAPGFSGL